MLKDSVKKVLSLLDCDLKQNANKIANVFGKLNYCDDSNQSLLHIFVDEQYNEKQVLLAVETLLDSGLNPNSRDMFQYNFIQTALYAGYSEEFILNIIKLGLKYNLNINHVDSDKDTIMHTVIYSDDYKGNIINIYNLLCENGFDSSMEDNDGRNLLDGMIYYAKKYNRFNPEQIDDFKKIFYQQTNRIVEAPIKISVTNQQSSNSIRADIPTKTIKELMEYGIILNLKRYNSSPTIGRNKELKNLLVALCQDKKNPIIVGESGVGKTALVDELAYQIQLGNVPHFLSNKIILEVSTSRLVAGCSYVGQFEEKVSNLINVCEKYDAILFIDEIHTIYGIGATKDKNMDLAAILKQYLDRTEMKIIGTTTEEEYNQHFAADALKRRFEKIKVLEPTEHILLKIIDKIIDDYATNYGIRFENDEIKNKVVNIVRFATTEKCRVYNDKVCNPDLAISIIDKAFAFAKYYDVQIINSEHFIEAFDYCERIYDAIKKQAITMLKAIDVEKTNGITRVIKLK